MADVALHDDYETDNGSRVLRAGHIVSVDDATAAAIIAAGCGLAAGSAAEPAEEFDSESGSAVGKLAL